MFLSLRFLRKVDLLEDAIKYSAEALKAAGYLKDDWFKSHHLVVLTLPIPLSLVKISTVNLGSVRSIFNKIFRLIHVFV